MEKRPTLIRGNVIFVEDTHEAFTVANATTPCAKCLRLPTAEGHDACLGTIPGVFAACCGHGNPKQAYIYFETGLIVRHFSTIERVSEETVKMAHAMFRERT